MKFTSSTPSPERTPRTGNGKQGTPSEPHYDAGIRFDSGALFADPTVPVDDGAKAKLDLALRADDDLLQFATASNSETNGNPLYPTPTPSIAAFSALITALATAITEADMARNAAKTATATKVAARAALEAAFNQRRNYIQIASNGNAAAILSSGLPLQNPRQPKGQLPPPMNFHIELNGVAGTMILQWDAVPGSEGYLIRCSPNVGPRVWTQLKRSTKPKLILEGMEVGQAYVFQVATAGGAGGQSSWSPEVSRTAA